MKRSLTTLIGCALVLSGCGLAEAAEDAKADVAQFHSRLDAGNFQAIWDASDERMRATGTQADFRAFLATVHAKLGKVQKTEQVGWRTNVTTIETVTIVNNATQFEKGAAMESFTFSTIGGETKLVGYNINSRDLIMNPGQMETLVQPDKTPPPVMVEASREGAH